VRRLRVDLTNAHFPSSSSTNTPRLFHPSQNEGTVVPPPRTYYPDVPAVSLCFMHTTLRSLTAPAAAPHADDVLDLEIANNVCLLSCFGDQSLMLPKV
jgi:hypothetical protein